MAAQQQQMGGGGNGTGTGTGGAVGAGGFRASVNRFLYSGEKKHVFVGILVVGAIFVAPPWYLMSRGSKHQSHQDYMEKADKARNARLSSGKSSPN